MIYCLCFRMPKAKSLLTRRAEKQSLDPANQVTTGQKGSCSGGEAQTGPDETVFRPSKGPIAVSMPSKGSIAAQILDIVREADRLMGISSLR